jgi:hypothetical protein
LKISYSGFSAYLQNPERYRLYYGLGLIPEGDDVPSTRNYGRRRGSCFHAIQEARATGVRDSAITKHAYPEDMYARCVRMAELVPDLGTLILAEKQFEFPIGDGKHSITGRIDHIALKNEVTAVGDFKTTKKRTKAEMREYFGNLQTSSQAHFYLHAAKQLGYTVDEFRYHVLVDDKEKPDYMPFPLEISALAVERRMRGVYAACEAIDFLTKTYGVEKPWPHSNHWPCCGDQSFCGYSAICGREIPKGCVPTGFVSRHPEEIISQEGS